MIKSKFLEVCNPLMIFSRGRKVKPIAGFRGKNFDPPGGVRYPGGIMYYPRPGEVEPEVTPSKLLRVERLNRLTGVPWFHKKIFYELGIGQKHKNIKENFVTIVKNIPEVNVRLWKIKHLVRITPITFPYGEPTMEDVKHTKLLENGECIVTKKIRAPEETVQECQQFMNDKKRMNNEYVERDCRLRWMNPWRAGF